MSAERAQEIDIHTTAGKIKDLERRLEEALHAGSQRAVEKQHAKGKMTARERLPSCSMRGPSSSSTSSPGTGRPASASTASGRTATAW